MTFGQLRDDELDAAVVLIAETTTWLLSKGIQQWLQPLPLAYYRKRQEAGANYALRIDGEMAVVVSLMQVRPLYWAEFLPETPLTWMSTLASARRFAGQNLGEVTVRRSVEHLQAQTPPGEASFLYIDCLYGYLPNFYSRLGFETIARKMLAFPGLDYDGVLMRLPLHGRT